MTEHAHPAAEPPEAPRLDEGARVLAQPRGVLGHARVRRDAGPGVPQHASEWDEGVSRRRFLELSAASLALAGLSACVKQPREGIVPYVKQPEEVVPGLPLFFATAATFGGYATGLLVESHEGRPTKIEGNPDHPASLGATDAFQQALVLSLYDPDRSQTITRLGQIRTWANFTEELAARVKAQAALAGDGLRILTQTVTSPTLAAQIRQVLAAMPKARWHQWEPAGRDAVRAGALLAYGQAVETRYDFSKADVVVTLDADPFVSGPGALAAARAFARRRREAARDGRRAAPLLRGRDDADRVVDARRPPLLAQAVPAGHRRGRAARGRLGRRGRGRLPVASRPGDRPARGGSPRSRRGGRVRAGRDPRALPRDQRRARRDRDDGPPHGPRRGRARRPGRVDPRPRRRPRRGPRGHAAHPRRQPCLRRAPRPPLRGRGPESRVPRAPLPLRRRDERVLHVAPERGAPAGGLDRRARLRRHRFDRAAARRAALRRQVRPRGARGRPRAADREGGRRREGGVAEAAPGRLRRVLAQVPSRRSRRGNGVRGPSARAEDPPGPAAGTGARGKLRARSQAGSRRLRRALRERRLAAGDAEAPHEARVGQRRAPLPGERGVARREATRTSSRSRRTARRSSFPCGSCRASRTAS